MLNGHIVTVPPGIKGFDADSIITPMLAAKFFSLGYQFAVRYVRRTTPHAYDLTAREAEYILTSGLQLMVVQHVAPEGWTPTKIDGQLYGSTAASEAKAAGVPAGVMLWCDLEGVKPGTPVQQVIDFCNEWHSRVASAGYLPGLYVGWHPGLTGRQLFSALRFTHYWGAYNVDEVPLPRGFQLQQHTEKTLDGVKYDPNTTMIDGLGGQATMLKSI